MTDEAQCGFDYGRVSASTRERINQIADQHDATFLPFDAPDGPQFWFSLPDERGWEALRADLERAGLWPVPRISPL